MSCVVHINGWPGSGKLTISRVVAKRLGGRLIDNHSLLNPAECLFERSDPRFQTVRKAIRTLVFDHAATLPPHIPIVLTDALADLAYDRALFDDCKTLAARRAVPLVAVVLACDEEENVRRITAPGRAELLKMTDTAILRSIRTEYSLLRPEGVSCIDLDVSALPPEAAADALVARLPPGGGSV